MNESTMSIISGETKSTGSRFSILIDKHALEQFEDISWISRFFKICEISENWTFEETLQKRLHGNIKIADLKKINQRWLR